MVELCALVVMDLPHLTLCMHMIWMIVFGWLITIIQLWLVNFLFFFSLLFSFFLVGYFAICYIIFGLLYL